jgi:hypothetical protein
MQDNQHSCTADIVWAIAGLDAKLTFYLWSP